MSFLPQALAVQLLLAFFVPPIPAGIRNIFAADLWCLLWVGAILVGERKLVRKHWRFFGGSAVLIGVVYLHGAFRVSFFEALRHEYFKLTEPEEFQRGREAVLAVRFLSWIWALWFTGMWAKLRPAAEVKRALNRLAKVLAVCGGFAVLCIVCDEASHSIRLFLGRVYRFDPDFEFWRRRAYGCFQSPLEAGMAVTLAGALLAAYPSTPRLLRGVALAAVAVALYCTQTMTAGAALLLGVITAQSTRTVSRLYRKHGTKTLAPVAVALLVLVGWAWAFQPLIRQKLTDLLYRFGTWKIYFQAAFSRLDLALLGFGLGRHHTDSSYVFIFFRSGLVGVALVAWTLGRLIIGAFRKWGVRERAIVLFLLIAGLALDVVIYRHVVYIMIAFGVPYLVYARGRKS